MPVLFDHIHHPVEVELPDGKKIKHTPNYCAICFQNMKDDMANRIWKFYEAQVKAAKQLLKKKVKKK